MRITLDEALARAARDDHDPVTLTASLLLAERAAGRRRALLRWLLALLAVALAVGAVAWFRPHVGPPPSVPSPQPTPSEFDLENHLLTTAAIQRRCPARPGEVVVRTADWAGGEVDFGRAVPSTSPTPSAAGSGTPAADRATVTRRCHVGYQTTPVAAPVTAAELTGTTAQLVAACQRHSGFTLGDGWHPVTSPARIGTGTARAIFLVLAGDDGYEAGCYLTAGTPTAVIWYANLADSRNACPMVWLTSWRPDKGWGTGTHVIVFGGYALLGPDNRPHTRVARVVLDIGRPISRRVVMPATDGFLDFAQDVVLTAQASEATLRGTSLATTMQDSSGRVLYTCTTTQK